MRTQRVHETGYYDTSHEYKVALLYAGEERPIAEFQPPAPCRGKQGKGVWCEAGNGRLVFIDFPC